MKKPPQKITTSQLLKANQRVATEEESPVIAGLNQESQPTDLKRTEKEKRSNQWNYSYPISNIN
jgi:hypothetical protein